MADDATGTNNAGTQDTTGAGDTTDTGDAGKTFTQADLDRIVADRVARVKNKYADYDDLKKRAAAAMTEQERAVTEAEQRGRMAAISEAGPRLVRSEFRAAAANRLSEETLDAYLEDVDLAKFIREDGEPDTQAIEARITKLGGAEKGTDFDGGARTPAAKPADMNALIRRSAGLGN